MVSGRKRSINYKEFGFTLLHKINTSGLKKDFVRCNVCQKEFANTAKSRMKEHRLMCDDNSIHKLQGERALPTCSSEKTVHPESLLKTNTKQSQLSSFFEILTMSQEQIKKTRTAIAEFFYSNNIPFRVVENEFFKRLITMLKPEFVQHLPNRRNLA